MFTCVWCWRTKYKAPWVLLSGVLILILGLIVLGSLFENFEELKAHWEIDVGIALFVFSIGAVTVYYSRILHHKKRRKWKNYK